MNAVDGEVSVVRHKRWDDVQEETEAVRKRPDQLELHAIARVDVR
jgi:hypothetical protein